MTICVIGHSLKNVPVRFHASKECIAAWAQQSTNVSRCMAVIHEKIALNTADQASAFLRLAHRFHVFRRQPVLTPQSGAQVFSPSGLRILATPVTKPFVPTPLIGFAVLTSCLISAVLAIGAEVLARLREPIQGEGFAALRTCLHQSSMTYKRDNTGSHADVLLEIANKEEA